MTRRAGGGRGRVRRAATAWALAALVGPGASLGGCARYAPTTPAAVPAGARVRVALTPAGTAALAGMPAGAGVVGLEGAWAGERGDTVRVRADRLLTSAGVPVAWGGAGGAEVALARSGVRAVELRAVDRRRTALAVAGGVAALAAFLVIIRRAAGGGGGSGDGGIIPF